MKITRYKVLFFSALLVVILGSCKKEYETIQQVDDAKISAYISANALNMTKDPSGYYYQVLTPGTNGVITNADSVLMSVKVTSLAGVPYYEVPVTSNMAERLGYLSSNFVNVQFIPGMNYPTNVFREAIAKIQRGGKVKVVIPSYLAYGRNGNFLFPANEVLIAEITVFPQPSQTLLDDQRIQQFITANNIPAVKAAGGVYVQTVQQGTGTEVAKLTSTLKFKFKGRLLNGTVFNQTLNESTYESVLNVAGVVGWRLSLVGAKAGTKVRLLIPSVIAYGALGDGDTPPNAVVDFDIEVVSVTN